jgi:hypothetical protein
MHHLAHFPWLASRFGDFPGLETRLYILDENEHTAQLDTQNEQHQQAQKDESNIGSLQSLLGVKIRGQLSKYSDIHGGVEANEGGSGGYF